MMTQLSSNRNRMEMEDLSIAARLARRKQVLAGKDLINNGDSSPNNFNSEVAGLQGVTIDSPIGIWMYATATWCVWNFKI